MRLKEAGPLGQDKVQDIVKTSSVKESFDFGLNKDLIEIVREYDEACAIFQNIMKIVVGEGSLATVGSLSLKEVQEIVLFSPDVFKKYDWRDEPVARRFNTLFGQQIDTYLEEYVHAHREKLKAAVMSGMKNKTEELSCTSESKEVLDYFAAQIKHEVSPDLAPLQDADQEMIAQISRVLKQLAKTEREQPLKAGSVTALKMSCDRWEALLAEDEMQKFKLFEGPELVAFQEVAKSVLTHCGDLVTKHSAKMCCSALDPLKKT
eukprot:8537188-Karenia_brevis.AAC.1